MYSYIYLKEDINSLINQFEALSNEDEELFRFLSKKIIFLKEIRISIVNTTVAHYIDQIISDLMYLIASYHKGEVRYFYLNIRSVIEAFARLFSEVETGTNRITMTTLLENISNYINMNNLLDSRENTLDYARFKSLYKECCLYVHGNINANYSLIEFYNELLSKEVTDRQKRKMAKDIRFLASILIDISCYRYATALNDAFFRGKDKLSFLIGEHNVNIVKSYSNFIILCLFEKERIHKLALTSKKGENVNIVDLHFEEYDMLYCHRPETLTFEDYDVYIECILKEKS